MNKFGSFGVALDQLERNSISAEGVRAIKICQAADDMLSALQAIDQAYNGPWDGEEQQHYIASAIAQVRAAIAVATD